MIPQAAAKPFIFNLATGEADEHGHSDRQVDFVEIRCLTALQCNNLNLQAYSKEKDGR
jgi:hypothetical protein